MKKRQSTSIAKTILKSRKKLEDSLPDFKTLLIVIMTVLYWQKGRHMDQRNRKENPEIDAHV